VWAPWVASAFEAVKDSLLHAGCCPGAFSRERAAKCDAAFDNALSEAHAVFWAWARGDPLLRKRDLTDIAVDLIGRGQIRLRHLDAEAKRPGGVHSCNADFSPAFRDAVRDGVSPLFLTDRLPKPDGAASPPQARLYYPFLTPKGYAIPLLQYEDAPKNEFGSPAHCHAASFASVLTAFISGDDLALGRRRSAETSAQRDEHVQRCVTAHEISLVACAVCGDAEGRAVAADEEGMAESAKLRR